jgi:glycosyltransferase involved in cell wall biosynthesis
VLSEVRIVEPVPAGARVRHGLREAARSVFRAPSRAAFLRNLERCAPAERREVRLNFGWLAEPKARDVGIGGAVKLAHLRDRFGEARERFNVLYLVSSILHLIPFPDELVRWAKRRGVKVVWNQNGVAYPAWCGEDYPWFNAPMARLIREADHVIYQSAFCKQSADRYLGAVNAPAEVLWNPVDARQFLPGGPLDAACWELLAMGTNHAFYRVKASIDCLGALIEGGVNARLTIAGEMRWPGGDAEIRDYIERAGLAERIRLLPPFTQEEAPAIYRQAHVLLHPKYKDPCPTVPIEAMACGIPVVGSRSGGMPELVPSECGKLVDVPDDWTADYAPDAKAMAEAVQRVMAGRAAYAGAAREWAKRAFDKDAWTDRHGVIFREALARE